MAKVEKHLHKKNLNVSNHPSHSGYMNNFPVFPLGTFPQAPSDPDNDNDNDTTESAAHELAESNGTH